MIVDEDKVRADTIVIRALEKEPSPATLETVGKLIADAYPVLRIDSPDKFVAHVRDLSKSMGDLQSHWIVAEIRAEVVGSMRLYDFTMNVRGSDALTGGVGAVAVALAHKRQGIARSLISWYLEHYRRRSAPFAILHAFRPEFYRKLGFGYGTPMQRYRFAPAALRIDGRRGTVRGLGVADLDALIDCSERVRARTNGLIAKHRAATERSLSQENLRYVGVIDAGILCAFMQTSIVLGDVGRTNDNTLVVRELHAEDDAAFAALLGYLSAQQDQFSAIVVESQDNNLFLASSDPRDGSDVVLAPPATHRIAETGLGMMYRLLDIPAAFAYLPGVNPPFTLRVEVRDPFFEPTAGAWTFRFALDGVSQIDDFAESDATLRIECADLASLVVGSLPLHSLVRHRLATLEPASMLNSVDFAFRTNALPICHARF